MARASAEVEVQAFEEELEVSVLKQEGDGGVEHVLGAEIHRTQVARATQKSGRRVNHRAVKLIRWRLGRPMMLGIGTIATQINVTARGAVMTGTRVQGKNHIQEPRGRKEASVHSASV